MKKTGPKRPASGSERVRKKGQGCKLLVLSENIRAHARGEAGHRVREEGELES